MQPKSSFDARRRTAFLRHIGTFAWVMVVLVVIDLMDGTDAFFIQWVAAIWGTILAVHFVDAFVLRGLLGFHHADCFGQRDSQEERVSS